MDPRYTTWWEQSDPPVPYTHLSAVIYKWVTGAFACVASWFGPLPKARRKLNRD